ncbi:CehA/McbA family metallohydrolase [Pseudoxanthomonas winnipegensis]|uniref:CehA/McbA family metallohydrolase n=1 Tax=Pseudoxanthomonas winnipegensis TaxID=2480810 RepID=UPI0025764D5C|nr:CehA/McbA family metallohydrolase [Pseudoxanthomonas winnipegensis]WJI15525.1 CehA/McbA family metallohydrolase [Pseudoxanthomonas winnipegensis]
MARHRHSAARGLLACLLALPGALAPPAAMAQGAPEVLELRGRITDADLHRYVEVPFQVPAGTARISVDFDYEGRQDRTVIDLGLLDPAGFRGWSGGSKRAFTVALDDATPSYLPGALPAGTWKLMLGVPNIRPGHGADYVARLTLTRADQPERVPALVTPTLRAQPGWYRGDLHMHSAHSDASCASQSGRKVPCPVFLTLQAAAQAGLDFVALTDHNTVSHLADIRELQPFFDRLLLIPGMELTTFQGHANVFGLQQWLDFRLGSAALPDWNAVLDQVQARGLLLSINHPMLPNDETCMGCGWTPQVPVDMARIAVVEAVNGQDADTPHSGMAFWHRLLDQGLQVTGVGGSDNHDATHRVAMADKTTPVGHPVTVVHAQALSQDAILEGIRAGQVYIDAQGGRGRTLEVVVDCGRGPQPMGARIRQVAGSPCQGRIEVTGLAGARPVLWLDGAQVATLRAEGQNAWRFPLRADGHRHWVRADVRDAQGRLALVGNPIYLLP